MNNKFSAKKTALLGIGAVCLYKLAKGEGIFNKPRFYSQHKAVESYLATYHPNGVAGNIVKNDAGWHCIVKDANESFVLNIHKTDDGVFVFSETIV